jgi:hypothetical protein
MDSLAVSGNLFSGLTSRCVRIRVTSSQVAINNANKPMLWTIIIILLVLWLLGLLGHVGGSLIHLLLVIAVIVLIINLVRGRGAP